MPGTAGWFLAAVHLRFTDDELATLIEMLSLACGVAAWNQKPSADQKVSEYERFESKMLQKAAQQGLGQMIDFDEETQRYQINKEIAEKLGISVNTSKSQFKLAKERLEKIFKQKKISITG